MSLADVRRIASQKRKEEEEFAQKIRQEREKARSSSTNTSAATRAPSRAEAKADDAVKKTLMPVRQAIAQTAGRQGMANAASERLEDSRLRRQSERQTKQKSTKNSATSILKQAAKNIAQQMGTLSESETERQTTTEGKRADGFASQLLKNKEAAEEEKPVIAPFTTRLRQLEILQDTPALKEKKRATEREWRQYHRGDKSLEEFSPGKQENIEKYDQLYTEWKQLKDEKDQLSIQLADTAYTEAYPSEAARLQREIDDLSAQMAALEEEGKEYVEGDPNQFWNDLGFGAETAVASIVGAVEQLGRYVVGAGNKVLQWATTPSVLAPEEMRESLQTISDSFGINAENAISERWTDQWLDSIDERYLPLESDQENANKIRTVMEMLPGMAAGAAGAAAGSGAQLAATGARTLGQSAGAAATRFLANNAGNLTLAGSAAGGSAIQAYQETGDADAALAYGTLSGALEAVVEKVAGNIPGINSGALTSKIAQRAAGNPAAQKLLTYAIDVGGEGLEEVITEALDPVLKRMTYDPDAPDATLDDLAEAFWGGVEASAILQGASTAVQGVDNYLTQRRAERQAATETAEPNQTANPQQIQNETPENRAAQQDLEEIFTPRAQEDGDSSQSPFTQEAGQTGENAGSREEIYRALFDQQARQAGPEETARADNSPTRPGDDTLYAAMLEAELRGDEAEANRIKDFYREYSELFDAAPEGNTEVFFEQPEQDGYLESLIQQIYNETESPYMRSVLQEVDQRAEAQEARRQARQAAQAEILSAPKIDESDPLLQTMSGEGSLSQQIREMNEAREDSRVLAEPEVILGSDRPSFESRVTEARKAANRIYEEMVSGQRELERMAKIQRKVAQNRQTAEDAAQLYRNASATAEHILINGNVDIDGNNTGESWQDVAKRNFNGNTKAETRKLTRELNLYMLHQLNVERAAADKQVFDWTAEESQKRIEEMDRENPSLKARAEEVRQYYNDFMHEWVVESGMMTEEQFQELREKYPHYIPVERADRNKGGRSRGRNISTGNVIQAAEGGNSPIVDIQNAVADKIGQFVRMERRNELLGNLYDFATAFPTEMAPFVQIADGNVENMDLNMEALDAIDRQAIRQTAEGDYTATVIRDGKKMRMYISEEMYRAMNDLFYRDSVQSLQVIKKLNNAQKMLITVLNPIFAARNFTRDFFTAWQNSIETNPGTYLKTLGRAIWDMTGRNLKNKSNPNYQQFKALGGKSTGQIKSSKGFVKSVNPGTAKKIGQTVKNVLSFTGEASETMFRYMEYLNGLNRYGNTPEGRRKAIQAAADVTVNFSRSGRVGQGLGAVIPFFNAQMQGFDKQVRQYKNHPTSTAVKGLALTVGVGALLSVLTGGNDDNPYYKQLTNRQKETYWNIPYGPADENGYQYQFIKIPKPRELPTIAANLVERAIKGDFDTFDLGDTLEITADNMLFSNPVTDNIFSPLLYNLPTNQDFAGRAIVPAELEALEPRLQYDAETSSIAKGIGEIFNVSPKQVDYLMDSYLGVAADILQPMFTQEGQPENVGDALGQIFIDPVVSNFTVDSRYSNRNSSDFYEALNQAETDYKSEQVEENLESDIITPKKKRYLEYNKIAAEISDLRREESNLINDASLSKAEREERILDIRERIGELQKGAEERVNQVVGEYEKIYVPEISMLSEQQQEWARELHDKYGTDYADYRRYYDEFHDIEGDENVTGSEGNLQRDYIYGLGLPDKETAALFQAFGRSPEYQEESEKEEENPEEEYDKYLAKVKAQTGGREESKVKGLGDAATTAGKTSDTAGTTAYSAPKAIRQAPELTEQEVKDVQSSKAYKRLEGVSEADYQYIKDRVDGYESYERAGWIASLGLQGDALRSAVKEFAMTDTRKSKMLRAVETGYVTEDQYIDAYIGQKEFADEKKSVYNDKLHDYLEGMPWTAAAKEAVYNNMKK